MGFYFSSAVKTRLYIEAKQYAAKYFEEVIREEVINQLDTNLLVTKDKDDSLSYGFYDTQKMNLILGNISNYLREETNLFNNNSQLIVDIPMSYLFLPTAYFFPHLTVPVTCSNLTHFEVNISSDVKAYGINSSLVSLNLNVTVYFQVMIPFITDEVDSQISIPLAIEIINGEVPEVLFSY